MLTLKLAFRNMLAHGQRSFIMFLAVGLVSCFVFLFMAFSDGEIHNFKDGVMAAWDPPKDITVNRKGFRDAANGGEEWKAIAALSLPDWRGLADRLAAQPGIAGTAMVSPSVGLDMQAGGKRYQGFWLRAMDPERAWQIMPYVSLVSGNWLDRGAEPQLMLHYKASLSLPVKPGDRVVLTGKDLFGQAVSQEVTLTGFFKPGQDNPNLTGMGYLNPAAWDLVSGFNPGEALGIDLRITTDAPVGTVIGRLQKWSDGTGAGLEFTDAETLNRDGDGIYRMIRFIFQFVSALIVFVVSFGVMSVVSVNLYDRKREIGTYYCLGSEKAFLIRLYTAEILMINSAATLVGIGLGLAVRQIINGMGIQTDDAGLQLVFGGSRFTLGLSGESVVFLVSLMLAVTLITALTTLGKRLKVSPVAALRDTE